MSVDLAGSYDAEREPSNDFGLIPSGTYVAAIVKGERRPVSKKADHGDQLNLQWQIRGEHYARRIVFQTINLWWTPNHPKFSEIKRIADDQFAQIRHATGVLRPGSLDEVLERECLISVGVESSEGFADRNTVKYVKAAGDRGAPAASSNPAPAAAAPSNWKRPPGEGATAARKAPPAATSGGNVFAKARQASEPASTG